MNKKVKNRKISVPVSLDNAHISFIERSMSGSNFSEKVRALIERAQREDESLVHYNAEKDSVEVISKGAICAYSQTEDEKLWHDLPFMYNKRDGYKKLRAVAESQGYQYQQIENKAIGFLAVYIGRSSVRRSCEDCMTRVQETMRGC